MRAAKVPVTAFLVLFATSVLAGTTLDFWHSYVHAQTHETNYSFHLSDYKRGLFWGSCGPSTKSLQWSFTFDLSGDGPVYTNRQVSISDDNGKPLNIVSGKVITDLK
ncbi:MAG TPA: hypothetical protein VLT36_11715 [Candidatus Dormibacteraeota bacterium]|nr:hypothetical protein [Candidatus Dormibacteraeota bacterium]